MNGAPWPAYDMSRFVQTLCVPCATCGGEGKVATKATLVGEVWTLWHCPSCSTGNFESTYYSTIGPPPYAIVDMKDGDGRPCSHESTLHDSG